MNCFASAIVFFIDEADHLPRMETFLRLLTRSREILFCKGYSFFIAGSVEVAKNTEAMGIIFDQLLFLAPVDAETFRRTLERRIQSLNPSLALEDVFAAEALDTIFQYSRGIRKEFLRMAEHALGIAAVQGAPRVTMAHCDDVFHAEKDEIALNLKSVHIKVLQSLAIQGACSPSDKELQESLSVSRSYLRMLLEELASQGYVRKEKRGRSSHYTISSQYRAYFAQDAEKRG